MLKLEFPNSSHEAAYYDMIEEWRAYEYTPTSPSRLFSGADFKEFLEIITEDLTSKAPMVPGTLFFLVDNTDNRILGAIQVRHHINHPILSTTGGHVGYGIRPSARGKGYAKTMLALALEEAKKLGIKKVLLTCVDTNIASWKVIMANGGKFEKFYEKDTVKGRRYWIDLAK